MEGEKKEMKELFKTLNINARRVLKG